jgi:quinol monooxygenase YgiN
MLVRVWTVDIKKDKVKELEVFANSISLPMFREQEGCLGVLFTKNSYEASTITFWDSQESIDKLATSVSYQDVVKQIEDSGILAGNHKSETYEEYGGFIGFQV